MSVYAELMNEANVLGSGGRSRSAGKPATSKESLRDKERWAKAQKAAREKKRGVLADKRHQARVSAGLAEPREKTDEDITPAQMVKFIKSGKKKKRSDELNTAPAEEIAQTRMAAQRKPMTAQQKTEFRRKWQAGSGGGSTKARATFARPGTAYSMAPGAPTRQAASTEYEGPSLREKLDRLKEEKYTPTTRPEQSRVRKQISKSVKSSGWFKKKSPVSGQTKLARVRPHEDPTSLSKPHTRAVSHATSKKGTLTVAHTEYEGPSLAEQVDFIKTFLEGHAEERQKRNVRRLSQEIQSKEHSRWSDKERTKNPKSYHGTGDRARTGSRGSNPDDPSLRRRRNRQASLDWKRKENSSTEYRGPSLKEKDDDAPTGGSYSTAKQAFKDKVKLLMKQKRPRPGVAATKAGRRQQSREEGGSGVVIKKKPHATEI